MTRVVLLRHGQTDYNSAGRFQGHDDIPLNAHGLAQASSAAEHLTAAGPLNEIICSDLARAHATAKALGEAAGLTPVTDRRLREVHVGRWGGELVEDVKRRWLEEYRAWRAGRPVTPPEGESLCAAGARGAECVRELAARTPAGSTAAVVAHGAIILHTVSQLIGFSGRLGGLGNCRYAQLRVSPDDEWTLEVWNGGVL